MSEKERGRRTQREKLSEKERERERRERERERGTEEGPRAQPSPQQETLGHAETPGPHELKASSAEFESAKGSTPVRNRTRQRPYP